MKITLRLDQLDSHAHFGLFVNGGKAGDLVLRKDEWEQFHRNMAHACAYYDDEFKVTDNTQKTDEDKEQLT